MNQKHAKRLPKSFKNMLSAQNRKKATILAFVGIFAIVGVTLLVLSQAATSVSSVKSGRWSDPTVWSTGRVPEEGDTTTIETAHAVTYDLTSSPVMAETHVRGTLTFDPNRNAKFVTAKNIIVYGKLIMKPANADIEHFIQLVNINESNFVGGTSSPHPSVAPTDIGVWAMDFDANGDHVPEASGQLDIAGVTKRSWTTLTGAVTNGATSVTLQDTPSGWRQGDEIIITPTQSINAGSGWNDTEVRTISSVSGNTVNFSNGLSEPHPRVNNMWTAEVGNITRNVRIEGTASGSGHIFVHSSAKQFISNAQLRYMAAAGRVRANGGEGAPLLGRYAVHFHHANDGSRGSVIDGVVVRDAGQHSFVPHSSHGIVMKNNIAFNIKGDAFWWDEHSLDTASDSHSSVWDHNLVASLDNWEGGGIRTTGFLLGAGHDNKVINNAVAGIKVGSESAGYVWDNDDIGVWGFDNNRAHNGVANGISVWQNSTHTHPIRRFAIYNVQSYGIDQGAYANDYRYFDGHIYGAGKSALNLRANSHSLIQHRYENVVFDGAGITPVLVRAQHGLIPGTRPVIFRDDVFRGYTRHAFELEEIGDDVPAPGEDEALPPKWIDIIHSDFVGPSPAIQITDTAHAYNRVRVQPKTGAPYQVGPTNTVTAATALTYPPSQQDPPAGSDRDECHLNPPQASGSGQFAPRIYGTGNGLLAQYYSGTTFTTEVHKRLEPTVSDTYTNADHHKPIYWVPWPSRFLVRWTGEFQAQEGGSYTFVRDCYSGARVWLDGELILDAWNSSDRLVRSTTKVLEAGRKYPIRIEGNFASNMYEERDDIHIYMEGPYQPRVVIPMSQLYCTHDPACDINPGAPGTTPPLPPDPDPTPPTPSADTTAPAVSVTAPANNATVSGTFNVAANASDNVGVTSVAFVVDGVERTVDITSPYSFSLNTLSPVLANGTHTVTARARDAAGNISNSSVAVSVQNQSVPAPSYPPEDINQDGRINLLDFSLLAAKFGQQGSNLGRADINRDGRVNMLDFSLLSTKIRP
jgi:hypothetical protein